MPRPRPTWLYHFTHIRNLSGILANGLLSDAECRRNSVTQVEIGSASIRMNRLSRPVDVEPGGCVGDYAPFYFAPRSPMMFTLQRGSYEYRGGFDQVVYLVTRLERVVDAALAWVASDRNAAQRVARFTNDLASLDAHVDWALMREWYWGSTPEDPERPDRRMAECLVRDRAPWELVDAVIAKTDETRRAVTELLSDDGDAATRVELRPRWYFD